MADLTTNPPTTPPSIRTSSRILLAAVSLLVVVIIAVAIHSAVSKPSGPPRAAAVTITTQGFVPATLTVKANTKVTWSNQDTVSHKVGANPYPSHASLPSLVSKTLTQGQSYSYTFTKSGTVYYHDDLHPTLNASIVVGK